MLGKQFRPGGSKAPQKRPEQLAMFMTPREIMGRYETLEGDRFQYSNEHTRTEQIPARRNTKGFGDTPGGRFYRRTMGGDDPTKVMAPRGTQRVMEPENNQQTWDRKLRESKDVDDKPVWNHETGDVESLHTSIAHSGVQNPVHLGVQFGSEGKREVVGGHHRIAAAMDVAPDQLIPVLHHDDIHAARSSGGYFYD